MSIDRKHTEDTTTAKLAEKAKDLIREGNARRIVVKNTKGETVMEIPVTAGVVAAVAAPVVTAAGAIGALAFQWTIEVKPPRS